MKDVTIKECGFSADMVPYMYAELSAAKSTVFETHLLECTACTDEFASLSGARYEVYDWKKSEFDILPTPTFTTAFGSESETALSSWTEKVRAAFSASWAVPGVALAAVALVSIFAAIFILSGDENVQIAANDDRSNTEVQEQAVTQTPENSKVPVRSELRDDSQPKSSEPVLASARPAAPKSAPRKAAVRGTRATSRSYEFTQASARNDQKKVPRLNEFAEDEDTSLRLAELFDDLEARN
jgi:hypothetical protein